MLVLVAQKVEQDWSVAGLAAFDKAIATEGNPHALGKAMAARGIRISQQQLDNVGRKRTMGQKTLVALAAYFDTTLPGLVTMFGGGNSERALMRAGDIVGWAKAAESARDQWGGHVADWAWSLAAEVMLPGAPDRATPSLVYDIAHLLSKYSEVTAVRRVRSTR